MKTPKVIFVDAVGTLFGVAGSVGKVYAERAQQFGVAANAEALNKAFVRHFKAAEPIAFPGIDRTQVPAQEYAWWKAIAEKTFRSVKQLEQFEDFEAFFSELYAYFAGADPWLVYPDTFQSLERWRASGIELGVISN
ncbi:MAG: HAD family hydrolase, partial [Cyanobacteria bacterium J06626_18]